MILFIIYSIINPLLSNQNFTQYEGERINCSVKSSSLQSHGLKPTRLLRPWDSPGKNTEVGSHSFLKQLFLTQGSNPSPLHCRQIHCLLSFSQCSASSTAACSKSELLQNVKFYTRQIHSYFRGVE